MGRNSIPDDLQIFENFPGQQVGQFSVILLVKYQNHLWSKDFFTGKIAESFRSACGAQTRPSDSSVYTIFNIGRDLLAARDLKNFEIENFRFFRTPEKNRPQKFSDPNWPCSSRFLLNSFGSKCGENYGLLLSKNIRFPYAPEHARRWKSHNTLV